MRLFPVIASISFLILITIMSPMLAESPALGNGPAPSPQSEADALLANARRISDIRTDGSPSFRLKASFSFVGDELETFEGTYTEMWVSDSQWRREIVMNDRRRIEVGSATRRWLVDEDKFMPDQAARVSQALLLFPPESAKFEFESVVNPPEQASTKCVITKPFGFRNLRDGFCFDVKNGSLVETISPTLIHERPADYSCAYSDFRKFGERWFPYRAICQLNGHRQLEAHVTELTPMTFSDTTLFKPLNGALEIGRCAGVEIPPKAVRTEVAKSPAGLRGQPAQVTLRLIIDVDGKAQNIVVVHSAGKAFDETAMSAMGRWRFKPATCDGAPMPVQIEIELDFRSLP